MLALQSSRLDRSAPSSAFTLLLARLTRRRTRLHVGSELLFLTTVCHLVESWNMSGKISRRFLGWENRQADESETRRCLYFDTLSSIFGILVYRRLSSAFWFWIIYYFIPVESSLVKSSRNADEMINVRLPIKDNPDKGWWTCFSFAFIANVRVYYRYLSLGISLFARPSIRGNQ